MIPGSQQTLGNPGSQPIPVRPAGMALGGSCNSSILVGSHHIHTASLPQCQANSCNLSFKASSTNPGSWPAQHHIGHRRPNLAPEALCCKLIPMAQDCRLFLMPGCPCGPSLLAGFCETRLPACLSTRLVPVDPDTGPIPVIPSAWLVIVDPVPTQVHPHRHEITEGN